MDYQWAMRQITALQMEAAFQQQQQLMSNFHMQQQMPSTSQHIRFQQRKNLDDTTSDVDEEDEEDEEQKRTLFCGNLDERVSEELLYEAFVQAGPVETVRIPKDNQGKQRSFGFVVYAHQCSVLYALKLYKGLSLFRKTLTINPQCSTVESSSSPSYQNRRSGGGGSGGNSWPAYYDLNMNDSSNGGRNPFKHNSKLDWTSGNSGNGRRDHNTKRTQNDSGRNHRNHRDDTNRNSRGGDNRSESRDRGKRERHSHGGGGGGSRRT